jgi:predicted dehydrogenase
MGDHVERREFIKAALLAGTATASSNILNTSYAAEGSKSPNEKLNLGVIGVAARGGANLSGVSSENIVALCDIDEKRLDEAAKKHPKAEKYVDFRKVIDRNDLDGIVCSTPDHMHAMVITHALKKGLAVYCEKPLCHSVYEADYVNKLVKQTKCVTQMGNQIHNHPKNNYRRVVEAVQSGVIGDVRRVYIWQAGVTHFQPGVRAVASEAPKHVSYDHWVGPAPYRPYHKSHFHFAWRYWWDFGGGQLADFWCHYADLPFWALKLGYPTSVHGRGEKAYKGENDVPNKMSLDYHYPARDGMPAVHLSWMHGGERPEGTEAYNKGTAVLFEGDKGKILADYTTNKIFMDDGSTAKAIEQTIPDSIGHHKEFIEAVKTKNLNTTCNFRYGSVLTQSGLLGNVSYRAGQKKLEWNQAELRATNCPEADQYIRRDYRRGWELA